MSWTINYQFLQSRNVRGLHFCVCNSQRRVTGLLSARRPFISLLHLATSYLSSKVQLVHHFRKFSQTLVSPHILVCFWDAYCKSRALDCNHQFNHFHPFPQHPLWALWEQDPCILVPTGCEWRVNITPSPSKHSFDFEFVFEFCVHGSLIREKYQSSMLWDNFVYSENEPWLLPCFGAGRNHDTRREATHWGSLSVGTLVTGQVPCRNPGSYGPAALVRNVGFCWSRPSKLRWTLCPPTWTLSELSLGAEACAIRIVVGWWYGPLQGLFPLTLNQVYILISSVNLNSFVGLSVSLDLRRPSGACHAGVMSGLCCHGHWINVGVSEWWNERTTLRVSGGFWWLTQTLESGKSVFP